MKECDNATRAVQCAARERNDSLFYFEGASCYNAPMTPEPKMNHHLCAVSGVAVSDLCG